MFTTVNFLPECASFVGFENGFEIWKGVSGRLYRVI